MLMLLKYDLKNRISKAFPVLLIGILAIVGGEFLQHQSVRAQNEGVDLGVLIIQVLLLAIMLGVFVVQIIADYRSQLNGPEGLLTFTLPVSTRKFVFSKLLSVYITSILLVVALTLVYIATMYFSTTLDAFYAVFRNSIVTLQEMITSPDVVITYAFGGSFFGAATVLIGYFCVALSRRRIRGRRMGALWMILFVILIQIFIFRPVGYQFLRWLSQTIPSGVLPAATKFNPVGDYWSLLVPYYGILSLAFFFATSYTLKRVDIGQ